MARNRDIDDLLQRWPYDPDQVKVRRVRARDGREVLQMRVDMGLMQLETDHRPDGQRPGGAETYFDYLQAVALHQGKKFVLDQEQCEETDRELMQFYQRRVCWLALRDYQRAVEDADHNLALMEFVKRHSANDEWVMSHEQYRPFILYQRTQAAAMYVLEEDGPEQAIETINDGLEQMRHCFVEHDLEEEFPENGMVTSLTELREHVRTEFKVGRTLDERLAEAIRAENYELAARLRDRISQRKRSGA